MRCLQKTSQFLCESSLFPKGQLANSGLFAVIQPNKTQQTPSTSSSLRGKPSFPGFSFSFSRGFSSSENNQDEEHQTVTKDYSAEDIRNVAIIAHVDHGKTTLVDALLRQSGYHIGSERAMDSNDLEQEKGITILSKCTSIAYKNKRINIVDTPGHQDFGGEVERIMNIVDGVLLLVCASDGPMVHTKYVLKKALEHGIRPIVVINKVDRNTARIADVESEVFHLLEELHCSEEDILNLKFFYAAGREGWAVEDPSEVPNAIKADKSAGLPNGGVTSILDAIIKEIPVPKVGKVEDVPQMLVTATESHKYFGKLLFGRVQRGSLQIGTPLVAINRDGGFSESGKIMKILKRQSMSYYEITKAVAGDIILVSGFSVATVGDTLNDPSKNEVISSPEISAPIVSVTFHVNNSPIHGKEGTKITAQVIRERLLQEAENDVALKVIPSKADPVIQVQGRGDLHLGVLVKNHLLK